QDVATKITQLCVEIVPPTLKHGEFVLELFHCSLGARDRSHEDIVCAFGVRQPLLSATQLELDAPALRADPNKHAFEVTKARVVRRRHRNRAERERIEGRLDRGRERVLNRQLLPPSFEPGLLDAQPKGPLRGYGKVIQRGGSTGLPIDEY